MLFASLASISFFAISAAAQAASSDQSSPKFVVRSRPVGDCTFNNTLGYLHPTYISSTPYAGTLRQARSDAITGYLTFLPDAHVSSLVFLADGTDFLFFGFYVNKDVTNQLISLPVNAYGGQGVYADAAHRIQLLPEPQISFYACPNWPLDDSTETAVFSKIGNTSIPTGCIDIDLVVEYLDSQFNYPVPCSQASS